jgi:hypothetical protein
VFPEVIMGSPEKEVGRPDPSAEVEAMMRTTTPPREVRDLVVGWRERTLCGGVGTVTWQTGPVAGMPLSMYCSEPFCIETGQCTGWKGLPLMPQWTAPPSVEQRVERTPSLEELVEGFLLIARTLRVPHTQDRRAIAEHVRNGMRRFHGAMKGQGDWK